jgi:prepilin-type N-terminal cleavage/methylation domain-containing protein
MTNESEKTMNNKQSGMTYIELLIGMAIAAVILSAVFMLMNSAMSAWAHGKARAEVERNLRVGIDVITRDARYAASAAAAPEGGILTLTINALNEDTIAFRINPTTKAFTRRVTTRFNTTAGFQPIGGDGTANIEGHVIIVDNPDTEAIFAIEGNLVSVTITARHKRTGVQATMHTKIFCANM